MFRLKSCCNNRRYQSTLMVLLAFIFFVEFGLTAALPLKMTLPDSDETIIVNSTSMSANSNSTLSLQTNVDAHIADFVPKGKALPKKVQNDAGVEKYTNREKVTLPTVTAEKTTESADLGLPPKHFPKDADEFLKHKDKLLTSTLEKLLQNTKDEPPTKTTGMTPTSPLDAAKLPLKHLPEDSTPIHGPLNFTDIPKILPTNSSAVPVYQVNKSSEVFDMVHSPKYYGQFDVDDVKHVADKMDKSKSDVEVTQEMDKNGPKSMPASKNSGSTVLSSSSNMVALSSVVLSSKPSKSESMLQPLKAIAATVLTIIGMMIFGVTGFLLWRRIMQRRFGHREMLINEDDFEEVSDLHHFQGTTTTAPNLVA